MVQVEKSPMRSSIRLPGDQVNMVGLGVFWLEATVNLRNIINRGMVAPALIGNLEDIALPLNPAIPVIL